MAANTAPIFPLTPHAEWCKLTAANTATDGTGTVGTAFTAAANGSRADRLVCKALGTNVATVARIFQNNGSTNATPANNSLIDEIVLPATNGSNVNAISQTITRRLNRALAVGHKINIVIATAVANGWQFTIEGGDY